LALLRNNNPVIMGAFRGILPGIGTILEVVGLYLVLILFHSAGSAGIEQLNSCASNSNKFFFGV
jgi:hypothetical protein